MFVCHESQLVDFELHCSYPEEGVGPSSLMKGLCLECGKNLNLR